MPYILKHRNLWFKTFIIIIVVMGVFFRFDNLDQKVYWHDEVYTSLRISGYNGDDVKNNVFTGEIVKPTDLLYFQQLNPDRDWGDTWRVLAEHPEHPPLYYVMARLWSQLWGSSIATTRGLAAIFSLLVLLAIFWLCWELFPHSLVGWWAIALVSVSPIHVLYAQEARQYSLWAVTSLLASAAFWRALEKPKHWLLYSLTLSLNFYTSLLSVLVAIAHAIYLISTEKFKRSQVIWGFLSAGCLAVISFIPWLLVFTSNYAKLKKQTDWVNVREPWLVLYRYWELHLSAIWLDFPTEINKIIAPRIFLLLILALIYLFYFIRNKPRENLFLILIIIIPILGLIVPDLIKGSRTSIMTRYFFPSIVGIQIAVSYWLEFSKNKRLKLTIFALIISLGILSCSISNPALTWWHKIVGYHNPFVAQIINASPKALIISDNYDTNLGNLISLSYLLDEKVDLLLYQDQVIQTLPQGYSNIFFYNPSPQLISKLDGYLQTAPGLEGKTDPNLLLIVNNTIPLN